MPQTIDYYQLFQDTHAVFVFDREGARLHYQNDLASKLFGTPSDLADLDVRLRRHGDTGSDALDSVRTLDTRTGSHTFVIRRFRRDEHAVCMLFQVDDLGVELLGLRERLFLDPLTRTLNRAAVLERFHAELSECERYGNDFWLMMFDLDHFKRVNDTWGHLAGDRVLAEVAARVRDALRGADVLGRYGGEEFLILLPETRAVTGFKVAERLRAGIEAHTIEFEGHRIPVTVSIGMTGYQHGDSAESMIDRADVAMYRAKGQGRNRAEFR